MTTTPTPTTFRGELSVAEWEQKGFIALAVIYSVVACTMAGVLVVRRERPVIAARVPSILVPAVLYGAYLVVVICSSYITGKTPTMCLLLSFSFVCFLPFFSLPYILAFPAIVFADALNKLKVDRANGGRNWRWRVKFLLAPWVRFAVILFAAAIQVATFVAVKYTGVVLPGGENGQSPAGEEHDCYRISLLVSAVYGLVYFAVMGAFAWQAIRVDDPYFVRSELVVITNIVGPISITSVVYGIAPQLFADPFDYRWIPIALILISFSFAIIGAVLLSFDPVAERYEQLESRARRFICKGDDDDNDVGGLVIREGAVFDFSQAIDAFKTVLDSPVLLAAFTDYAVKNWSVENVLFYKAVEVYKEVFESMNPESRREKALAIVDEFVMHSAPLQINIEHGARMSLLRQVAGTVTVDVFNAAQKHVYDLMKKDSFEKWQKTPGYRKAIEKVAKKRGTSRSQASHIPMTATKSGEFKSSRSEENMSRVDDTGTGSFADGS